MCDVKDHYGDDVSVHALRLLKYREVSESEISQSVAFNSSVKVSNDGKLPSEFRATRIAILLERSELRTFDPS